MIAFFSTVVSSNHRRTRNTNAHRNRIYEKIAEARMSSGNRQLSELDSAAKYRRPNAQ